VSVYLSFKYVIHILILPEKMTEHVLLIQYQIKGREKRGSCPGGTILGVAIF
jgi:hypothetical protein